MLTALLIDDQSDVRESLALMLSKNHLPIRVIGEASNGDVAVAMINELRPDLLFLDVDLGRMSGFDVLQKLDKVKPDVIFVTGFNEFAAKAFRFNAIDYLTKPVGPLELTQAVMKAIDRASRGQRQLESPTMFGSLVSDRQVALPDKSGLKVVHLDDIYHCSSDNNYTEVYTRGEKASMVVRDVVSKPLSMFDEYLSGQGFCRVHASHLVNVKHILRYVKGKSAYVVLSDHARTQLPVSDSGRGRLLAALPQLGQ